MRHWPPDRAVARWRAVAVAVATLAGPCHHSTSGLRWSRGYLVQALPGGPAALYGRIDNRSDHADTLVGIATSVANRVEMHAETMSQGPSGGVMMSMTPVARLTVPAHRFLVLSPGQDHGMLTGVTLGLHRGDSVVVVLRFLHAAPVSGRATVIAYTDVDSATAGIR
jgi:copper(I)-binding protein